MDPNEDEADAKLLTLKQQFLDSKAPFYYASITEQQARMAIDRPARGQIWASRTVIPQPPEADVLQIVLDAIRQLGSGIEEIKDPSLANVKVQWSGFRPGAGEKEPEPRISESAKYRSLLKDSTSDVTIVYFHGGFFYAGSPAASRGVVGPLTRLTGARCLLLDHRLAPQHAFPCALLDAMVAYLTLLYPPKGSWHEAIRPTDIVFAGDSAGGNLLMSLLLTIQNIHQTGAGQVNFWNKRVHIPFPAGAMMIGNQGDLTFSFPFTDTSRKYDFLQPIAPCLSDITPPCPIWPSDPPRGDIYCEISALCHPLVSHVASKSWANLPPLFFAYGEEHSGQEGKYIAQQATEQGVIVEYHHYQHLSHIFPIMLPGLPQSRHVIEQMARFCRTCAEEPSALSTKNIRYAPTDMDLRGVDCGLPFSTLHPQVVRSRMIGKQTQWRVWTGSGRQKKVASL